MTPLRAARRGCALGAGLLFAASAAAPAQQAPSPQQPAPVIRSRITVVPIDVRVVDRSGKPITDLREDEFTVLEDGVPQTITHFSPQAFVPDPSAVPQPPQFRRTADPDLQAANRRVFLLLLGRGRHQAVSKYVDEMKRFVERDVLPQDQVAVMIWNRATDFTTDHAAIAGILERYRDRHEPIESDLRDWFSGLRAVYGSKDIPPRIQSRIDAVFDGAAAVRPRALLPNPSSGAARNAREAARAAEDVQRDEILKTRQDGEFLPDMLAESRAGLTGMDFDEYVSRAPETMQDLGNLFAAIDYLRYLEGEKHIVMLTENGVWLPHLEGNHRLASIASDARIAINIIQTGGMPGARAPRLLQSASGVRVIASPLPSFRTMSNHLLSVTDLEQIAETTGGQLAAHKGGADAFRQISGTLGFQYLLAYAPARAATDGQYRRIEIKVRRPGAEVQYRRGYFASPQPVTLDRREFVTFRRMRAAALHDQEIDHIRIALEELPAGRSKTELTVRMTVDISRLALPVADGVRKGAIDVAVYCVDRNDQLVGQVLSRVDITLTDDAYQRALGTGAPFQVRVPLTGAPRQVKAVVYDYAADLVGTASIRVK